MRNILRGTLGCLSVVLVCMAFAQQGGVSVRTLLQDDASWDGTPLHYPEGSPDVHNVIVDIAPGAQTGWHRHPVPAMAYVLEGELELQLKDGRTTRVRAGESVMETVDTWHNGINVGSTPVKLVAFYLGVEGQALTEMEQPAQ